LPRDQKGLVDGHRAPLQELGEILAVDELEHERPDTVRLLEAIDRCDVRMMQRGQKLRFAAESGEPRRVRGERARQHLDRDVAVELRVPRAVDLAHSTLAEGSEDLVGAEAGTHRQSHFSDLGRSARQSMTMWIAGARTDAGAVLTRKRSPSAETS
jgi:hypothetical protein